ncbi:MAG: glycerol-3-phosphate dehydrogenase/oxidase [Gemmatimonadota bacterium]|nr:glycerol-3-phosphate dehydrogenase/oxidase [Gemmatimonadota bacterium]
MRTTLEGRIFDLLVIGGGITGAGVARDAAMRGLEVALVEKEDFASGTSGRSSRLIHGGIRYLERGQLGMVRESVREREILLRIAPHLVKPLEFTWPVYRRARITRTKLRAALSVYSVLAGRYRLPSLYSAEKVMEREPLLQRRELKGGASYTDATTDDSRLTLANILSAKAHDAVMLNHTEALRPISRDRGEWLVKVRDGPSEMVTEVRTRVVVNATGPWRLNLERRWPQHRHQRRGSKGVHIALPRDRVGNRGAVTITSPDDGRVMFVLPDGKLTIVGTTDTWTSEPADEVRASAADCEYLLNAVDAYFPEARIGEADLVSAWAGIRPLADWDPDKKPSDVSREHRITQNGAGMITVSGGKLTTYRAMAEQIVNQVERELGKKPSPCTTGEADLPGKDRADRIAATVSTDTALGEAVVPELPYTMAELRYAIEHEMALTLSDLLMRRTRIAFELADHGVNVAPRVVDAVAASARWSDYTKRAQVEAYIGEVARVFGAAERSEW